MQHPVPGEPAPGTKDECSVTYVTPNQSCVRLQEAYFCDSSNLVLS